MNTRQTIQIAIIITGLIVMAVASYISVPSIEESNGGAKTEWGQHQATDTPIFDERGFDSK